MKPRILTGLKFGKLYVTSRAENIMSGGQVKTAWNCVCECGNTHIVKSDNLLKGQQSCGCSRRRKMNDNPNWKGVGDISGRYICAIKTGAKARNLLFEVDLEYLWKLYNDQSGLCALSNFPIKFSQNSKTKDSRTYTDGTASLDRIDSSKGYIKGNVQWVHKDINILKSDFSEEYFLKMCTAIVKKKSLLSPCTL